MGCGVSLGNHSSAKKRSSSNLKDEAKERDAGDDPVETAQREQKEKKNGEYDSLAFTTYNPRTLALLDYRGHQVHMANATVSKLNTICRWVDNVLEIRESNGGWIVDPQSHNNTLTCWDNVDSDSSCLMMFSDSGCTNTNKSEVGMQSLRGQASVRHLNRSMTSRSYDRNQPMRPTDYNNINRNQGINM